MNKLKLRKTLVGPSKSTYKSSIFGIKTILSSNWGKAYFKPLIIISSFFFIAINPATSQGIIFSEISYTKALEKAKQENKYLFIDAFTTWCLPCKVMDKEVFSKDKAGELHNNSFISLKIDMEKGEGIELRRLYHVNSFPTLIYLSPEGKLVNKVSKSLNLDEFVSIGMTVLEGKSIFSELRERYTSGERSIELLSQYADLLKSSNDYLAIQVADEWFAKLNEKEKTGNAGWDILANYITGLGTSIYSNAYRYLQANRDIFNKKYTPDSVNKVVYEILRRASQYAISMKDSIGFFETLMEAYRDNYKPIKTMAARREIGYWQNKDSLIFFNLSMRFRSTYFASSSEDLASIAWIIADVYPSPLYLDFALICISDAIKLDNKEVLNYEIKANVLQKMGNSKTAIQFLESSISQLKQMKISVSRLERQLARIKN